MTGAQLLAPARRPLRGLAAIYRDLHRHPELAFSEYRTAAVLAGELDRIGFRTIAGVADTGVVGVLRRGPGPTVLVRAELDALPITECTGVKYAAPADVAVPAMHACGHDLHLCWLIGACRDLTRRTDWSGTIIALGQPAEETGEGASAMVEDGVFDRVPAPDVLLAQHVSPAPVGTFSTGAGTVLASSRTISVRFTSRPGRDRLADDADPARLAARFAAGLSDLPTNGATVGIRSFTAGDPRVRQAITPDEALVRLVVRCHTDRVWLQALSAVEGLASAVASAQQAPEPMLETAEEIPAVSNDLTATRRVVGAVRAELGQRSTMIIPAGDSSDDFSRLVAASGGAGVYSYVGGGDADAWIRAIQTGDRHTIIGNHSAEFLPVQGSLEIGVRCYIASILAVLRG